MDYHYYHSTTLIPLLLLLLLSGGDAANFEVHNNCPDTVWAAAIPVGGGRRLENGQSWNFEVPDDTASQRIWGRTKCNFDAAGKGSCETGDCGGALECTLSGQKPATLAEVTLSRADNFDTIDISLVDGFNLPMEFAPKTPANDGKCRSVSCKADIIGQCPDKLKVNGGCADPCTIFKEPQYCCVDQKGKQIPCGPTEYSKFFKDRCPDAYSYPSDDQTSTFGCRPGTTDYRVVFCP